LSFAKIMHKNSKINCIGVTIIAAIMAIFGSIENAPPDISTSFYNLVYSH